MATPEPVYTHGHHESVLRSHRWRTAENSAAYLAPRLQPGMRLLDVGCGPGTITTDLAVVVAPGSVLGIDVAADVVDLARVHARERGIENVEFEAADLWSIDPLEPFDVVHAHQVLQHLADPIGALGQMARLTRPGGLVAARDSDYSAMTWSPADERLDLWLATYLAVTTRNGGEANAGRHLLRWARDAGLVDVEYSTSTWTFATPVDRAWWGALWAERIEHTALANQALDYGFATTAQLSEMADGWRAWAATPDSVFVVVHGEILAEV